MKMINPAAKSDNFPSGPSHRHHRIPRFYLKGFVPNPKKSEIWIYWDTKNWNPGRHSDKYNPCLSGFNKTAAEQNAYAFPRIQGSTDSDTIEKWLRSKEEMAKPVLLKLRAQLKISTSEKEILAEYIQITLRRTLERDKRMQPVIDRVVENSPLDSISLELAQQGDFVHSRMVSEIQKHSQSTNGKKFLLELSRVGIIPELHDELVGMNWMFLVAPAGAFFVTSSFPVIYNEFDATHRMLIFPIARNIVLLAKSNLSADLQFSNALSDEVAVVNFAFIRETSRADPCEIYASNVDKQVLQIWREGMDLSENQKRVLSELYS